jgi:hypothetical protein
MPRHSQKPSPPDLVRCGSENLVRRDSRNAAESAHQWGRYAALVANDVLRVTYLDLACRWRIWHTTLHSVEQTAVGPKKTAAGLAFIVAIQSIHFV